MRMKAIVIVIIILYASLASRAQTVTCQQLISEAAIWNGRTVSITGEVVGDILRTGEFKWLNVNDGTNALGVWANIKDVEGMVIVPGNYSVKGTFLELEGVFNRTCSLHSGETDIHLVRAVLVGGHSVVAHPVDKNRLLFVAILSVFAAALTWLVALSRGASKRRKA